MNKKTKKIETIDVDLGFTDAQCKWLSDYIGRKTGGNVEFRFAQQTQEKQGFWTQLGAESVKALADGARIGAGFVIAVSLFGLFAKAVQILTNFVK